MFVDVDEVEGILIFVLAVFVGCFVEVVVEGDLVRLRVRIVVMLLGRQVRCIVVVGVSSLVRLFRDRVFSASGLSCFVD